MDNNLLNFEMSMINFLNYSIKSAFFNTCLKRIDPKRDLNNSVQKELIECVKNQLSHRDDNLIRLQEMEQFNKEIEKVEPIYDHPKME